MTKEQQLRQEDINLTNAMDREAEKRNLAARLLEELTPGGSEFYNDPQYCFDFVKAQLRSIPSQVLPFKKENEKLKQDNAILLSTMKEIAVNYPVEQNPKQDKILCEYLIARAQYAVNKVTGWDDIDTEIEKQKIEVDNLIDKSKMKIYKLICPDFGHKFSFNAKDIKEAESKMKDWCLYHSFPFTGYKVEETNDPKWMHNEYVN